MNELALFAGAGGGILGGKLLGWRTVCAVEWEPYPAAILAQRQNEKVLENFPIWDDIQTFDGNPWRGIIDVVSGGFPCQDISSAGKGTGIDGDRSSMWYHMLRVIKEVEPQYCFIENSPHLRTKGLTTVLQGLAEAGYNAAWGVLSAKDCGANHDRKRMWIVGKRVASNTDLYSKPACTIDGEAQGLQSTSSIATNSNGRQCKGRVGRPITGEKFSETRIPSWWETTPELHRVDDGVAFGMDRLKAIGNGQVPIVAATAFFQLKEIIDNANSTRR
jgi:DNA (cytosine-5)-methyltransferase 1